MQRIQAFVVFWGVNTLVLWMASRLIPGVVIQGPESLLLAGLCFGLMNVFLKPILFVLTLPITVLTLGVFALVLNAGILLLVAWMVPGFTLGGFWQALVASLFISFTSFLINLLLQRPSIVVKRMERGE
jgi:putative membrane protein